LPPYPECLLDRDNSRRQDSSVNAYWRSVLRECDPPRVKVARPTEAAVSADKAASAVHASVPAAVSRLLRDVARHYDVTPFLAFVAAYAVTIGLLTGAHHIPVGTAAHGRPTAQLKRIAGMFATTLVLPVDLAGELTFGDLLARLRETYRAVMANRHVTLEDLSAGRNLVRAPIFRHVLSYHPASFTVSSFAGMPASMELISETGTQYELELHVRDLGDSFSLQLRFDPAVFDTGSAAAVAGTLSILLADLPANPQKSIASCQVSLPHDFTQEL
jgi:non-ribosomal peptide synthetase component F